MRYTVKATPKDFIVEELLASPLEETGAYAVYRVTKRLLTTLEVQERIAQQLNVSPRDVVFPTLKDKGALATQFCTVRGSGPQRLSGAGYEAHAAGRMSRHLNPRDISGNRFTLTIGVPSAGDAERLAARLREIAEHGLPNYFDEQRFGSYSPGGLFIGKAILQRDAEAALRAYFTQPAPGDPPDLRAFKRIAKDRWPDWKYLFEQAPRSNHRSILSFFKDHPSDFRKAVNLITPRLLPLLLSAYQSFLWNRIASRYLQSIAGLVPPEGAKLEIAGEPLALYRTLPKEPLDSLRRLLAPLPNHQARLRDPTLARIVQETLAQEGFCLGDMKARILQNAYLAKGERPLLLFPREMSAQALSDTSIQAKFVLPPGAYATLVVKVAASAA